MSRLVRAPVRVETAEGNIPICVHLPHYPAPSPVLDWGEHYREWIGILDGEPERDIWVVKVEQGICELHCLRRPTRENDNPPGEWLLYRWMD